MGNKINLLTGKEIVFPGLTGDIVAQQFGADKGIPVLTLHGWLDNSASFAPLAQCLDQFRWICLDMPGHGKSAHRPAGCIYHFTDYIADLDAVYKAIGSEKINLVGHSLGAGVAAMFAATFPQKVNQLVLIDGLGPIAGKDDNSLDQFKRSMAFLDESPPDPNRRYNSWDHLIDARIRAGDMLPSSAELLVRRGAVADGGKLRVLSDKRLKQHSPIYMSQKKVLAILKGIEAPILLVLAKDGLVISRKTTDERIDVIKDISVVEVNGFHHVHMDSPEIVAAEIKPFMEKSAS